MDYKYSDLLVQQAQPQVQFASTGSNGPVQFVSVDYEVFGQVQGCYFTKYLKEFCDQRAIGGWVKNSRAGTILGKVQGSRHAVDEVVSWLQKTGSPGARIDRVDLKNWEFLARQEFRNFSIRF